MAPLSGTLLPISESYDSDVIHSIDWKGEILLLYLNFVDRQWDEIRISEESEEATSRQIKFNDGRWHGSATIRQADRQTAKERKTDRQADGQPQTESRLCDPRPTRPADRQRETGSNLS